MKANPLKVENYHDKFNIPQSEVEVMEYWDAVNAFEKSVENRSEDNPYVFYDGPPFATGMPHYGHLLASTIKDVVPRYFTMKGHRVERVWGWDCHGLPIENMIEKQLKLKGGKKGIEDLGIDKFNHACRSEVLKLDKEWEKIIKRLGRWVDFKNNYKTMDTSYMESVWWAFKELYQKDLVYKGRRVILYCPRCATPLSNFEIAMDNSYKDVSDNSIFVKFKVKSEKNTYLLAWTTTPWTLIGNVGLAVKSDATYVKVSSNGEEYYLAKDRLEILDDEYSIIKEVAGSELEGVEYESLYSYLDIEDKKAYYVATGDFVTMDDGTGIVHTAAMYGEDDYQLALDLDLPRVDMLDDQGKFMDFVTPIAGQFYKKAEKWVVKDLEDRGLMLKTEKITHSYPHCYRCETPLYYTAIPAWFVNIQKLKPDMIDQNENINWYPDHLKNGRFGKGLQTAPDWNISRSRYWGTPMPIWQSEDGEQIRIIGSIEELKKWAIDSKEVENITDIHREFIDHIKVWIDDEKTVQGSRIPEVFDCWVESGSMPYASEHYPFENKEKFESRHPAQFIAEYIAQTRAWFYTLHVMSVGLFGKNTFENAVTTGNILAKDGNKMSKSKKNYPDPQKLIDLHGVDALRLYMMSSPIMKAENLSFSEEAVKDINRRVISIWWNVFKFYQLYADKDHKFVFPENPAHVMDRWLISRVESITGEVTAAMDSYDVVSASRTLMNFVNEFSNWYLRLSRGRLRAEDNQEASQVFGTTLYRLSLMFAPFTPFFSEKMYHNLDIKNKEESIHHEDWIENDLKSIHERLEENMRKAQEVVSLIHAQRKELQIKLIQPLASVVISESEFGKENLHQVILEETNIKSLEFSGKKGDLNVQINTDLTPELEDEGEVRRIVGKIQKARKKMGVTYDQEVVCYLPSWPVAHEEEIKKKVLASSLQKAEEFRVEA